MNPNFPVTSKKKQGEFKIFSERGKSKGWKHKKCMKDAQPAIKSCKSFFYLHSF